MSESPKPGDKLKKAVAPPPLSEGDRSVLRKLIADGFAKNEADWLRRDFNEQLHIGAHESPKAEMINEIIGRIRAILYREILSWLEGKPIPDQQGHAADIEAIQEFAPYLVNIKGRPYRPMTRAHTAIQAMKLKADGLSLKEVTTLICDCGQAEHTESCQQTIRQVRMRLEKLFNKHHVKPPTPAE